MARFSRSTNIARLRSRSLLVINLWTPHAAGWFGTGPGRAGRRPPAGAEGLEHGGFPSTYGASRRIATGQPMRIVASRADEVSPRLSRGPRRTIRRWYTGRAPSAGGATR